MTLTATYGAQMDRLRDSVALVAERMWLGLPYYTDDAIPMWLDRIGPVIGGAQAVAVTTHDAFVAAVLGDDVIGVDPAAAIARGSDAAFETLYRAPFLRTWKHVADGFPFPEARQAGATLAGATATEDLQRATLGANAIALEARPAVQAYRRVVSGAKTCKFCFDAAGQTYGRSDLMPIHPKCDCIVVPITGRAYVARQGQRGIGTRYDRDGRPVSRPTAQDERARKRQPGTSGDHGDRSVA